jgi:hypothetical protein
MPEQIVAGVPIDSNSGARQSAGTNTFGWLPSKES